MYGTRNAGKSWEPLMRGLPQRDAYETVLRDAMVTDCLDPVGLYVGTRSGQLFVSRDEGKNWHRIAEGLPPILCVRNVFLADASAGQESAARKSSKQALPQSPKSRRASESRRRKA